MPTHKININAKEIAHQKLLRRKSNERGQRSAFGNRLIRAVWLRNREALGSKPTATRKEQRKEGVSQCYSRAKPAEWAGEHMGFRS
jgi:hypothetical protein